MFSRLTLGYCQHPQPPLRQSIRLGVETAP
jgi:hypothetical protein